MALRISRRKLAQYAAEQLQAESATILQELAAYLIDTRREREADLLARDIETELEARGLLLADVASTHGLSAALHQAVTSYLQTQTGVKTIVLRERHDASLLGGIKITTPTAVHDSTIKRNITALRALKQ